MPESAPPPPAAASHPHAGFRYAAHVESPPAAAFHKIYPADY